MDFQPYRRDPQTLARPWAIPGTPGLEANRVGGLERQEVTGNVNHYDATANHEIMVRMLAPQKLPESCRTCRTPCPQAIASGDLLIIVVGLHATGRRTSSDENPARQGLIASLPRLACAISIRCQRILAT